MIKKTKDYPKLIADKIREALEYNEDLDKNPKEGYTPIQMTSIEISKGLYNLGSIEIRDNVCKELGIKPWDAPFWTKVHDNCDYWWLEITYK